jgi:hypothetical protein
MRKLASPRGNGNAENINSGWKLAWRESIDDHRKLTFLDAAVAGYLSRRWKSGGAIASYAMIAKAVGCTPRGAMNSVARLISVGALKLEKRGNSCRQANEYSLHKLVNETSLTSERNDIELVNETTPLSTGLFPQSSSLGDMKEKEGKKGSGERSEIDGESESSILFRCDRILQRHSDNPTKLLSPLRKICSAREILELVSAAISSGRNVEGELKHVLGQRRIAG